MTKQAIDWSGCDLVEVREGTLGGAPVVKDTRLPVRAILDNSGDGLTPAEIAEQFPSVTEDQVRRILSYARTHAPPAKRPRVPSLVRP
jgi:uncharacterized protein (DUF433 family)